MFSEHDILTSVFIPHFFEPRTVSTDNGVLIKDKDFNFEYDLNGILSIIKLKKIPYIDLSFYDYERRKWYIVDQYNNLWRKYTRAGVIFEGESAGNDDFIIETNSYFTLFTADLLNGFYERNIYYSKSGMIPPTSYDYSKTRTTLQDLTDVGLVLADYVPITIKLNNIQLTDKTNYSTNQNIVIKLDNINPSRNKEFYFDTDTIYTNQNLAEYDDNDIYISYYNNIDNISINCRMATNSSGLSYYTPIVDYYIVRLVGQTL